MIYEQVKADLGIDPEQSNVRSLEWMLAASHNYPAVIRARKSAKARLTMARKAQR